MIIKEFFFKIQGQFKDKVHFFTIPGVFQDQGHFQGLFKVCANPVEVTQGKFLYNYFKIDALVKEEKSFKGFSIFSSGSHLVQRSGTV